MNEILVIDNYDSFVYNLVHYVEACNHTVVVRRNDTLDLAEIEHFQKIIISPGPGIPSEAGMLKQIIQKYAPSKAILGVCLGQQAIAEVFGGSLINLPEVYHGVSSVITQTSTSETLFKNLPEKFEVGRYHSWAVKTPLPPYLEATSVDENGIIMSLRHKKFNVKAVQFHPESVLTPYGKKIIENWLTSIS